MGVARHTLYKCNPQEFATLGSWGSGEADTFLGNHLVSLCRPGWVYQTVCIHGIYRALAARNNKKLTTFTYLLCLSLLRAHVWMLGQFSEFVMSCHISTDR